MQYDDNSSDNKVSCVDYGHHHGHANGNGYHYGRHQLRLAMKQLRNTLLEQGVSQNKLKGVRKLARNCEQKIKLLILYQLLFYGTDEDHPISTENLAAQLAKKGIKVERRALARDIDILCEWGFEVQKFKKKSYYYFIADRKFDLAELELLVDLVQSANCLSDGKTKAIVEKIADLAGIYGAELLKRNVVYIDAHKKSRHSSIYSIDTLLAAIANNKKVSFLYTDTLLDGTKSYRKNGERYAVNPLELCCSRTDYYLVCYSDNHDGLADYRVDRMESVKIEEEERTPKKELENFNVHKYRRQMFSMYSGSVTKVDLLCENKVKDSIWDQFGDNIKLYPTDAEHFRATVEVQVSKLYFSWVAGSQGAIRIESPRTIAEEFEKFIQSIKDNY